MSHLPPHLAQVVEKLRAGLKELYGDRFRGLLLYGSPGEVPEVSRASST